MIGKNFDPAAFFHRPAARVLYGTNAGCQQQSTRTCGILHLFQPVDLPLYFIEQVGDALTAFWYVQVFTKDAGVQAVRFEQLRNRLYCKGDIFVEVILEGEARQNGDMKRKVKLMIRFMGFDAFC